MTTTEERLDRITIDLVFALRDSLTEVSPLEFWSGRGTSAITTAAASSTAAGQAITRAARKLQIETITGDPAAVVARIGPEIDADYPAWARHIQRNLVYIAALAYAERDLHKRGTKSSINSEKASF